MSTEITPKKPTWSDIRSITRDGLADYLQGNSQSYFIDIGKILNPNLVREACQVEGCPRPARRDPSTNETKYCIKHCACVRDPSTNEIKYCVKHGGGALQ